MAIKQVHGNFILAAENMLAHQVNCQGVIGSNPETRATNIAYQIIMKWKVVYMKYTKLVDFYTESNFYKHKDLMGMSQFVKINDTQKIVNMFAQFDYGNDGKLYTDYKAFEACIMQLATVAQNKKATVAMPYKIGCARGGADWDKVYLILKKYFGEENQPSLTLYKKL